MCSWLCNQRMSLYSMGFSSKYNSQCNGMWCFWTYLFLQCHKRAHGTRQGPLKIWTEHSTLIFLNLKPFEIAVQKFQHAYNLRRNEFSPNLEGVAPKMGPLCPLEGFDIFGGKSKSEAAKAFIFSTKRVPIKVNNWWKFGVDILNHFWEIRIWIFCYPNSFPMA